MHKWRYRYFCQRLRENTPRGEQIAAIGVEASRMALTTEKQKAAHLLRRFGLGASEAELAYYTQNGLEGAMDLLLNYENVDEGYPIAPLAFANKKGAVLPPQLGMWWSGRLLTTRRPLQEKMTLFWHNHFATSASKVNASGSMWIQNETFRKNATGNFRTMLHAVGKDPAMIFWLDTQLDRVNNLNENFAREVMELFTLGIGHYTETDIRQGARAYTGWSLKKGAESTPGFRTQDFIYRPRLHDDGDKTVFGQTGNYDGDQLLDILADMSQTAKFIVEKLWSMFVYPNPDPAIVDHLAETWRGQNLEIKPLLKTIMTMPEFFSAKAERAVYKCPVDFVVTTARQMGVGSMVMADYQQGMVTQRALQVTRTAYATMADQSMKLFYPPNVAGWKQGQAWISSATLLSRVGWGDSLFGKNQGKKPQLFYNAYDVFKANPSVPGMVDKLTSILDAPMTDSKRRVLITAGNDVAGGDITEQNVNLVAARISQVLFADPDFQFC